MTCDKSKIGLERTSKLQFLKLVVSVKPILEWTLTVHSSAEVGIFLFLNHKKLEEKEENLMRMMRQLAVRRTVYSYKDAFSLLLNDIFNFDFRNLRTSLSEVKTNLALSFTNLQIYPDPSGLVQSRDTCTGLTCTALAFHEDLQLSKHVCYCTTEGCCRSLWFLLSPPGCLPTPSQLVLKPEPSPHWLIPKLGISHSKQFSRFWL